jgi:hypothetical protein
LPPARRLSEVGSGALGGGRGGGGGGGEAGAPLLVYYFPREEDGPASGNRPVRAARAHAAARAGGGPRDSARHASAQRRLPAHPSLVLNATAPSPLATSPTSHPPPKKVVVYHRKRPSPGARSRYSSRHDYFSAPLLLFLGPAGLWGGAAGSAAVGGGDSSSSSSGGGGGGAASDEDGKVEDVADASAAAEAGARAAAQEGWRAVLREVQAAGAKPTAAGGAGAREFLVVKEAPLWAAVARALRPFKLPGAGPGRRPAGRPGRRRQPSQVRGFASIGMFCPRVLARWLALARAPAAPRLAPQLPPFGPSPLPSGPA